MKKNINNPLKTLKEKGWEIKSYSQADERLISDHREIFKKISASLVSFQIPEFEIMSEGGGKHPVNKRFSKLFNEFLDKEIKFQSKIVTTLEDETQVGSVNEALSHSVDFFHMGTKSNLGIEIEWNSKVLAFERDIMNFRRLFINSAIGLGIIITRGESLEKKVFKVAEKFFKSRISNRTWKQDLIEIRTELEKYKDINDKPLKFKSFTERQLKEITKSIKLGTKPWKAVAVNYVREKYKGQTSHIDSLEERIKRGGFQGVPLLCIGIPGGVVK